MTQSPSVRVNKIKTRGPADGPEKPPLGGARPLQIRRPTSKAGREKHCIYDWRSDKARLG